VTYRYLTSGTQGLDDSEPTILGLVGDHRRGDLKTSRAKGRTVLYINSDSDNRILMTRMARRWHDVTLRMAEGGAVGMSAAVILRPDLIVLDAELTDIDPEDLMLQLRTSELLDSPTMVVLAGEAGANGDARYLRAGASAYLTKPLHITQFEQTAATLLELPTLR
jgi:CheY-like chemotaxis protein